jgi:two-component system, OmpR family, sensor kinase
MATSSTVVTTGKRWGRKREVRNGTLSQRWDGAANALRTVVRDPGYGNGGLAQLAAAAVLLIPAWLALGTAALIVGSSTSKGSPTGITILSVIAGQLAIAAAGVLFLRAWATRERAQALAAAGLLAYGINKMISVATVSTSEPTKGGQILGNTSLALAFGLLLIAAVHRPGVGGGRHPLSLWAGVLVVGLLVMSLSNVGDIGILSGTGSNGVAGSLIVAAAWGVLGWTAIYTGRGDGDQMKIWIGFTAICLAQARLVVALIANAGLSNLAAATLQTVAIALVVFGSIRTMQEIMTADQGRLHDSLLALQSSEDRRRQEADAHEEAVHNLRSAMTAISSATHLLVSGNKSPLHEEDRSKLTIALQAALDRANRLLRREWDGGLVRFSLLDVLSPIVVNERTQGAVIDLDVPLGTTVIGNPDRAYEVLATLLDNARKHAPGSPVTVRVVSNEDSSTVIVEDRGPGIPEVASEQIFERGWTTSARRDGLGLGLYVARALMEEQGGTLSAGNRPGGGARFELRFPGGDTVLATPPPPPGETLAG